MVKPYSVLGMEWGEGSWGLLENVFKTIKLGPLDGVICVTEGPQPVLDSEGQGPVVAPRWIYGQRA